MASASEMLKTIFSTENDDSYCEREDNKPENGESVVTDKGPDSDNGPKEQEVQSVQEDGKDVDEVFNEEHTDENPASVEDLDEESIPSEQEVEKMSEEIPEPIEEGDTTMTEDGPDVENPPVVDENETPNEETPPALDPEEVVPPTEGEGEGNSTDPNNGEAGIDPVQALEAIIQSREEDIQIIKGDTQISIDEENKVSIDQNADNSAASTDEGATENTETPTEGEGGENTENTSEEGGENTEDENQSTESMKIKNIAEYFC